ncbi:beta strand repeat-containing protein, partial [Zavarzinia sp.]|uniref:beta strand repeat-containing protein n=1 Tax=Zavarzinia sp. TaxID=2027920 RepID=UPI003562383D
SALPPVTLPATTAGAVVSGTLRAGDRFAVELTLTAGGEKATVSYTAVAGDTADKVAAALAALINASTDPDAAGFTAAAKGGSLFMVNRNGAAFGASPSFTQVSAGSIGETVATTATLNAAGSTVVAGETWTLTLTSGSTVTSYSHLATGTDLQAVLDELVALVNADTASPYTADSGTDRILVFRLGGVAYQATLGVTAAGVAGVDPATARTATVTLSGIPVIGETWSLALAAQNYALVVGSTIDTVVVDTLDEIAAAFAGMVNADNLNAAAYTATYENGPLPDSTLVIINRNGVAVTAAVSVTPATPRTVAAGAPTATVQVFGVPLAGEVWAVTLAGRSYQVTVDASTDTLAEIAAALAEAIRFDNTVEGLVARLARAINTAGSYVATASGLTLSITAGAPITAKLKNGASNVVNFAATAATTVTLNFASASLKHAETWSVEITQGSAAAFVTETAFDRFTAASNGTQLLIADLTATAFVPQTAVTPVSGYSIDATPPAAFAAVFGNTPVAGQIWTLGLAGPNATSQSFSLTVGNTYFSIVANTQQNIVEIFARMVNTTGPAAVLAATEGNRLVVVSRDGAAWGVAFANASVPGTATSAFTGIEATGHAFIGEFESTLSNGHIWTITLTGADNTTQDFNVTIGDSYFSIVANSRQNVAEIFARLINAGGPAALTAMAEGNQLAFVSRDGSAWWTAAFAIAPAPAAIPATVTSNTLGATTVTFTGSPQPREIWSLTVAGTRFDVSIGDSYTVGSASIVADSVEALATIFADRIGGLADFHVVTTGKAMVIVQRGATATGFAAFATSSRFIPALDSTADLYDVTTAAGGAWSIELVGAPVAGEKWSLTLTPATGTASPYHYYVVAGDDLAGIAAALAENINATATGFVASVEGERLVLVKTSTGSFTAAIGVTPADDGAGPVISGNQALVEDAGLTPRAWTAVLAGSPVVGEVWRVTINSVNYSHTVAADETTTDIAAALATSINAGAYAATSEGRTLVIIDPTGAAVAPSAYQVAGVTDPRFAATGVDLSAGTAAATLTGSGTLAQGLTFTLLLRIGETAAQHTYVTGAADTKVEVIKALAAAINVNAPEDFIAQVDGDKLLIVNRAGTNFELANVANAPLAGAAVLVDLLATKPFTGEVWTIILDDATFTTTHSHVVAAGETLEDVARELSNSIVSGGIVTFTATALGKQVVIVNLAGKAFVSTIEVTPVGQVSIIETREFNAPLAGNEYFYRPVNLNTRVDEADQVDTLTIYNGNSPADDEGVLTEDHLTGLGMAGATVIAGRTLPGGIVYRNLEVLNVDLGRGNDIFHVISTHSGATNIFTGAGNDEIHVQSIDGHTTIDGEAGDDSFSVGSDAAPHLGAAPASLLETVRALLTIIGGAGTDTLYVDDRAESDANAGGLTGSTLTGLGMPSISEVQTIYVQAAAGVYTLRIADQTIDSLTATTTLLELSGTPIHNDDWSIVIDGLYRYTVRVNTSGGPVTVNDIAAALAAQINGTRGLTVVADGAVVVIVNAAGVGFQASFEIVTSATAPSAVVTELKGATAAAVLSGTLLAGDTWTFTVGGQDYSFLIGAASDTHAELAALLAAAINGGSSHIAIAVGDTVVVVDRAAPLTRPTITLSIALALAAGTGSTITVDATTPESVALTLSGTPVAGERWYVAIGANEYGYTVREPLADIALGLRNALNALSGAYSVSVTGNTLTIASSGPEFRATVSRSGNLQTIDATSSALPAQASITLTGDPLQGEIWTLTLHRDGAAPLSVAVTVDSLAQIAQGLASAVAGSAATPLLTASVEGRTLVIVDPAGGTFPAGLAVQIRAAGNDVAATASATGTTVALSGAVIAGEKWVLNLQIGNAFTAASYTAKAGDTLALIANGLRLALANSSDPVANQIAATVSGNDLVLGSATAFSAAVSVDPAASVSTALKTANTAGLALSGTPLTGDRWIVTLNGTQYSVTRGAGNVIATQGGTQYTIALGAPAMSLDDIGRAFAKAINVVAPASFTAFYAGSTLYVSELAGAAFEADAVVALATPTSGAIAAPVSGSAVAVTLSGDPVSDEIWRLTVGADIYSVVVGELLNLDDAGSGVDTPAEIAQALAAKINAVVAGDIVASPVGTTLMLVSRSNSVFAAAFEIELAGLPAGRLAGSASIATASSATAVLSGTPQAGEIWQVTVNGNTESLTINTTTPETRQQVAAALAGQIDGLADFITSVITPSGDSFIIVSVSAAPITVSSSVTRPGSAGTVTASSAGNARVLTLSGAPLNPSTWQLTVDGFLASVVVGTSTVTIGTELEVVDTTARIALKLAELINTNLGATHAAVAAGEQVTIVRLNGAAPAVSAISIVAGGTVGTGTVTDQGVANDARSLLFSGVPVAGEMWTLTYDTALTKSLTVTAGMSLADVVASLAAQVNAVAGYSAIVEGTTLVLAKNGAAIAAPALVVTPVNAINPVWVRTVTLSGTPVAAETW